MFGVLTAVGAFITIPLQPVPFTLQTLFMGLAAVLVGGYAGSLSQIIYLILGIIGLPVFAGGKAGFGILLGPTGGYLIGFVLAAAVIGKLVESKKNAGFIWIVIALSLGHLLLYTVGTAQLCLVAKLSPVQGLLAGVIPFLPGDAIKLAVAAWLALQLRPYVKR